MGLPNRLKSARLVGGTPAKEQPQFIGALETALSDILGIPIDTDIIAKMFSVIAGGLVSVHFGDLAADPTVAGQLARSGFNLKYHDGSAVRQLFMGAHIRKPTDEIRAAGTTLAADAALLLPMLANEYWHAEFWVYIDAHANSDAKFTLIAPAGATGIWGGFWVDEPSGVVIDTSSQLFNGTLTGTTPGKGNPRLIHLRADILNGGTPGNLAFHWAQNTAGTGTTVLGGSVIHATRPA